MKVMDLQCSQAHEFEGWFASEQDFQAQLSGGLLVCPVCGDAAVKKLPSAPRLNLGAAASGDSSGVGTARGAGDEAAVPEPSLRAQQAALMRMMREVVCRIENVGERFAEEARRMHYGEVKERAIRGQVTQQQAHELREEGIDVLALPPGLDEPLQ